MTVAGQSTGVVEVVVRRVRTLLGNPRKDRDMIIRHIEIGNDEAAAKFQSYGLRFDTRVVVLSNIPANSTDLKPQQQAGAPLFDLLVPEQIDWKQAGYPAIRWQQVGDAEVLLDTDMGPGTDGATVRSVTPWIQGWEWRGGVIFLSPASVPVDLRVRGQFMPLQILSDAQDPIRAAVNVIAFTTAWSVLASEGGAAAGSVLFKGLQTRMLNAYGDFQSNQVKAQQLKPLRFGGRRTNMGGGGFPPPIG